MRCDLRRICRGIGWAADHRMEECLPRRGAVVLLLALAIVAGGAAGPRASPARDRPVSGGWKPIANLKMTAPPFSPNGDSAPPIIKSGPEHLASGLAWVHGNRAVAVPSTEGLAVWWVGGHPSGRPSLRPYPSSGLSEYWYRPLLPVALVQRRSSFGIALLAKGRHGANPRLVVGWYTRRDVRLVRLYRIHLRRIRNFGVHVATPAAGAWFATTPIKARRGMAIRLWDSLTGKRVPLDLPRLRRGYYNSAFSGGGQRELVWTKPPNVYLTTWASAGRRYPVVSRIGVGPRPFWRGCISSDGRELLLLAASTPQLPGQLMAFMVPVAGAGAAEEVRYLAAGMIYDTAAPVFAPNGALGAFAVVRYPRRWRSSHWDAPPMTDLFVATVPGLRIVRWARSPAILPLALSFAPSGDKLALVTTYRVLVFDVPSGRRGVPSLGLPLSPPERFTLQPPRLLSTKHAKGAEARPQKTGTAK